MILNVTFRDERLGKYKRESVIQTPTTHVDVNTSKAKYCVLQNGVFFYNERNAFQLETEWRLVIDWFVMRSVGVGRLATR